jgi:hypothetical protein
VLVAHLLILQVNTGSFETGQWGEIVYSFSQGRHSLELGSVWNGIGMFSMVLESRMSQSLILFDAVSSAY